MNLRTIGWEGPLSAFVMTVFVGSGAMPLLACAPAQQRVLNAVEIAEWTLPYKQELALCRTKAKELPREERFNAYVECEEIATAKTCKRLPASARSYWAQCDTVKP